MNKEMELKFEIKGDAPRAAEIARNDRDPKLGLRVYFGAISDQDITYNQWKKAVHLWTRGIPQQIVRQHLGSDSVDQVIGLDLALRVAGVFVIPVDPSWHNSIARREFDGFYTQEVMKNG